MQNTTYRLTPPIDAATISTALLNIVRALHEPSLARQSVETQKCNFCVSPKIKGLAFLILALRPVTRDFCSSCKGLIVLLAVCIGISTSAQADSPSVAFTNSLQQDFVLLPSNSKDSSKNYHEFDREFTMGTVDLDAIAFELPDGNLDAVADETPAHTVRFRNPLYMATTEVTQAQWLKLMGTKPGPDSHWQRPDWRQLPVVSISWDLAQTFIAKLNQREPARHYRLPTEAEWEYAARAGSTGVRPFPLEQLDRHAWTLKNSGDTPQPVATRLANAWGLYDLFGNAWEWVADRYQPNAYAQRKTKGKTLDPQGPETGDKRVRRGGSYHCPPHLVRSAYRAADKPNTRYSVLGFRLVASP